MLLVIDIGNTMTDFGLWDKSTWRGFYRISSKKGYSREELIASFILFLSSQGIDKSSIDAAIISSVVPPLTTSCIGMCEELFKITPKILGPKLKTGLRIVTDNPKEVGADMIASAVAVKEKYGYPTLVVDLGTATKVYLIDETGAFVGCCIGAGVGLQVESLSTEAALLPVVSPQIPAKILGKNTVDSMNSALTYGTAYEIRGLCDGIESEYGYDCKRVLCGGFADCVRPLLSDFSFEPHLTLEGLVLIAERNSL